MDQLAAEDYRKELARELGGIDAMMRGSIVQLNVRCGNKGCRCYRDKSARHPAYYFSVNVNKKTKMMYLGKERLKEARRLRNNYQRAWEIIEKMTAISLKILKNMEVRDRRKRG